jgi:hypothetical protein
LFVCFWPHCSACGLLVPQPGIEPRPSAVRVLSPNHWITREFLVFKNLLYIIHMILHPYNTQKGQGRNKGIILYILKTSQKFIDGTEIFSPIELQLLTS